MAGFCDRHKRRQPLKSLVITPRESHTWFCSWRGAFRGNHVSSQLALNTSRSGVGKAVPGSLCHCCPCWWKQNLTKAVNLIKMHVSWRGLQQPPSVWAIWLQPALIHSVCFPSTLISHALCSLLAYWPHTMHLGIDTEGVSRQKVLNTFQGLLCDLYSNHLGS